MPQRFSLIAGLFLMGSGLAIPQTPAPRPAPVAPINFNTIPRPPLPFDEYELITGEVRPIENAQQRIAAIAMLEKARALSNIRAQPYHLKTTFVASGGLQSDGNWTLDDMSSGPNYRWQADGPNYSAVNLYPHSTRSGLYARQSSANMPLRLLQVRNAIWFIYQIPGSQASIRTASGLLNGRPQDCLLVVIGAGQRSFTGGRNWEESEYCTDQATGLLSQFSPSPGLFVRYDYSTGIQFHGKSIPTSFTIYQSGRAVVEAHTISVSDPPPATDPIYDPAGMTAVGTGREQAPSVDLGTVVPVFSSFPQRSTGTALSMQVVAVHGAMGQDGKLSDIEILSSTDSSLNERAVQQAAGFGLGRAAAQPGVTREAAEVVLKFGFIAPAR